mmetsp:Transcript_3393/g.5584  ORF Transcript_3393/g.5584 Transcript_3393/m.5584 type:complete len:256 (+) Transcript_3393:114-881(+)|eukprot:CAMPEP_0119007138 /NCGR_PEP_ID=MMETSP1176-20130426/2798_1 /TAXON_ID=265551 /ORGANISM="Synedropsis recta cf, Strain CCMP1620" /LENGTH=255 /DNA_ID=CAMNT_0006959213 /DNA_START=23 /DNA_END=790 /DNA_ORIENTATION=+
MCRPTTSVSVSTNTCPPKTFSFDTKFLRYCTAVWLPLVFPPGGLLNEGFTRWWLRLTIAYLLIRNKDLCKFQAVLGLCINVGWYSASLIDYFYFGHQFGNILLRNVRGFRDITIAGDLRADQLDLVDTPLALTFRVLSLLIDFLLHPALCYYFWHLCWKSKLNFDQITSWPVLCSTFILSRCWSAAQVWARYGKFGLYYYGHHVYYLPPNADQLYTIGYIAEAVTYTVIIGYKVYKMHQRRSNKAAAASASLKSN